MRSMVEGAAVPDATVERARALRRRLTLPEVLLWQALRQGRLAGLRFRRQHPIGPYVVDFYAARARLAVEVDGSAHDHPLRVRSDTRRDAWLAREGVRVLRICAADVLDRARFDEVLVRIRDAAAPSPAARGVPPPRVGED